MDMNKQSVRIVVSLLALCGLCACNHADRRAKVVLNEVLTCNGQNFQDDYGTHNAWIELFNKSYGSVDVAGYVLAVSSRPGDTARYIVPKGDVQTLVKPRQHALFWADGQPSRGTFHTSCVLDSLRSNWVGLYDSGHRLLDEVTVPVLEKDLSYARIRDAAGEWEVKGTDNTRYVTPSTNNLTIERNEKVEKFRRQDQSGIGMSVTAMTVVFSGLVMLYILFKYVGRLAVGLHNKHRAKHRMETEHNMKAEEKENQTCECGEEVYAAIALALHEALGGVHDVEKQVLTIRRTNSPWSGKWNVLRVIPQRK